MRPRSDDPNRAHWEAAASRVARRVNLGWWLETLSAPLLVVSLLAAAGILLARRELPDLAGWILPTAVAAAVAALAGACWWLARRRFEKADEALVRIEAAMRLRNSLTTARAGVAPWPAPANRVDAAISWQWPRLVVPPLGALALLAAGIWIPISKSAAASAPPEEPQAWKQLSAELEKFSEEKLVDEKYLEETRKKLAELKSRQEDQWFSHSSLEATDTLKKAHKAETERLKRDLERAGKALETLEKNAGSMNQAERTRLAEEFDQALQGLKNGAMKPNKELLEQMKGMDLKDLAKLSPEQMQQLRENLQKNMQAMKDAAGEGGEDWSDELQAGDGEGEGEGNGEGEGEGEDGEGAGKGGVNRGPGHADGVLGTESDRMDIGKLTGIESKDLSDTTPGDLLELQNGEHEVDQSGSRPSAGGQAAGTGSGGDRVWKESLDPDEQRTLKKFFE